MWLMMMSAMANGSSYTVIDGDRPLKDLHASIRARQADFSKCFIDDDVVKMRIVVGRDGLVSDAKFSMTDVNHEVATCVTRGTLKLRFAPSTDAGPTSYQWLASKASLTEKLRGVRPDIGDLHVTGGLTKEQVQAKIDLNKAYLQFCFRKAVTTDNQLVRATMDLHFGIDAAGTVVSAEAKHSDAGEDLAKCTAQRMMSLTFDKPSKPGITQVIYPMEFRK